MTHYKLYYAYVFYVFVALPIRAVESIFEKIAQENLASFTHDFKNEHRSFDSYSEYLQWHFDRIAHPEELDKRKSAFTLLIAHEKANPSPVSGVMDYTTLQDLNLFKGSKSAPSTYLAGKVDRTSTQIGKAVLFNMIAQPLTDVSQLQDRQAIVKELLNNRETFDCLDKAFDKLANYENLVLSLFGPDGFEHATQKKKIYIPYFDGLADLCNRSSALAEISERLEQLRDALLATSQVGTALLLPLQGAALMARYTAKAEGLKKFATDRLGMSPLTSFFTTLGLSTWIAQKIVSNRWTEGAHSIASGANSGMLSFTFIDQIRANRVLFCCIQTILMHTAGFINTMKLFKTIIGQNPCLNEKFAAIAPMSYFLHTLPQECSDLKQLLDLLSTDTFQGEPSIFSLLGRILVAFRLLNEHKQKLAPALIALGEIDAFMSIARLYKETESSAARWCFAQYSADSTIPFLESELFWNPAIDPDDAITNSIYMGVHGNPRSIIITGPNAGGKSTAMTALVKGAILAQTLGIAPCAKLHFTPFAKIRTYLNITDDIAAGNSHFKAGVLRAHDLATTLDNLKDKEYSLMALDEVFNGTTCAEGEAAAYSLINILGRNPANLCMTTTHFPLITTLESKTKGQHFKNYKVSVDYNESGGIVYPFKLLPGIANQTIAFDILKQEGFTASFLAQAYEVLAEHKSKTG